MDASAVAFVRDDRVRRRDARGALDEHTSVPQLKSWIRRAPDAAELEVFEGVGHYELEGPSYDGDVAARIVRFIADRGLRA
ncbi:hypothetical protein JL720_7071 [Aureococcus anophagefferens]|nr:hypothetical protein JL720_7071 [Aureococcus anophagefferens]